jgi:hypothetical protein
MTINAVYSKHAGKMTKFNYSTCKFFFFYFSTNILYNFAMIDTCIEYTEIFDFSKKKGRGKK